MDIEGTYTLQALPEEVWVCLMDLQTLRRTIPGIEQLERLGEDTYVFSIHIRHAPLRGSYSGQAVAVEQDYPFSYHMTVEGEGHAGKFHGEWTIELRSHNENTVVAYQGTLHFAKGSALLPMPLVKGTLKVLIQQFFTMLSDHLRTTSRSYSDASEDTETPAQHREMDKSRNNVSTILEQQPTFLHRIVRQLGLGGNDPLLEEQWVVRLRRIGFISVLLLLVWVGTRLPRKPGDRKRRLLADN